MYTVIGRSGSRARRVIWMLEELGQPYTHVPAMPHAPEVRAHHSHGKLPVLLAEGTALTESVAIMTFLADRHGAFTAPAGSLARARQDAITHFLLDEFDARLWMAARHSFVLPEAERMPEIKASLRAEFPRAEARLAEMISPGPFLMGETMTMADILAVHCLDWAQGARFPLADPALAEYAKGLRARPAYQQSGNTDDSGTIVGRGA